MIGAKFGKTSTIRFGLFLSSLLLGFTFVSPLHAEVKLKPSTTSSGYLALLLVNESPFPGESGWVSETDTKDTMLSILWVCDNRISNIPSGYRQSQVAATTTNNIIDVITVGGEKGQCDGFYRDANGTPRTVPRIQKRVDYLTKIANQGSPGKFARLLNYAQGLANAYNSGGITQAELFARVTQIQQIPVTGRAYSWMTNSDTYSPGGNFVRIPDSKQGKLGGNRFFTLRKLDE
ncbi:hypothetical protein [Puniceicoccus vermicola]|uniref:Uncharacterized protein n=1 Tax=Puniceicoccus vermicola TaxID=388746 RepID=A0A7X1B151_9BACT|nr:hypothetical protein [Puniceicoccus vermicola]MBC2603674.1 hypothetical protein [Puniceicoccus vermicola]